MNNLKEKRLLREQLRGFSHPVLLELMGFHRALAQFAPDERERGFHSRAMHTLNVARVSVTQMEELLVFDLSAPEGEAE